MEWPKHCKISMVNTNQVVYMIIFDNNFKLLPFHIVYVEVNDQFCRLQPHIYEPVHPCHTSNFVRRMLAGKSFRFQDDWMAYHNSPAVKYKQDGQAGAFIAHLRIWLA
jgi:hypothetical protein